MDRILGLLTEQDIQIEFIDNAENYDYTQVCCNKPEIDVILINVDTNTEKCLEVLKIFKQYCPKMPVFMFSGYKNDKYKVMCFECGVDYYFDKPSDINRMIDVLIEKYQERNCSFKLREI